jgi:hypothetical protein
MLEFYLRISVGIRCFGLGSGWLLVLRKVVVTTCV